MSRPAQFSCGSVQNQSVQSKSNPPYMLSTTPHAFNKPAGHSSPASLALYERSFQGPFPSISDVNFDLQSSNSNKLLATPIPFKGGAKKVVKKKKSVVRKKKSVVKRKKSVVKRKKSVVKRKKSVVRRKKPSTLRKKSVVKRKKSNLKRKKGGATQQYPA